jgi:hypothetical protein
MRARPWVRPTATRQRGHRRCSHLGPGQPATGAAAGPRRYRRGGDANADGAMVCHAAMITAIKCFRPASATGLPTDPRRRSGTRGDRRCRPVDLQCLASSRSPRFAYAGPFAPSQEPRPIHRYPKSLRASRPRLAHTTHPERHTRITPGLSPPDGATSLSLPSRARGCTRNAAGTETAAPPERSRQAAPVTVLPELAQFSVQAGWFDRSPGGLGAGRRGGGRRR